MLLSKPRILRLWSSAACALLLLGLIVSAGSPAAAQEVLIVTGIEFTPTQYLTADEMLSVVTNTKIGEPFDRDKLMADLWAIYSLAMERHGREVFHDIEADLVPDENGVKVIIHPIEIQTVPATVPIAGFEIDVDVIDKETFLKHFTLEPGPAVEVEALIGAVEEALAAILQETGYYFYYGLQQDENNVVHIQLRAARIASITFEGNEKTRDYVIEREIESKVGEPLNLRTLSADQRRIFQLRHFNDVYWPELRERPDDPLLVDVIFRVEERQTGSAAFGAGYSSNLGLSGFVELADENLFGRGQQAALRIELGQKQTQYDLSFYDPNIAGTRFTGGFGIFNIYRTEQKDREGKIYNDHTYGGQLTFGKRFTDFLQGSVRLRVQDTVKTYTEDDSEKEDRIRSVRLRLAGDTTDHPFYPTRGLRYGLSTEVALAVLKGNTAFTKYEAEWSGYRKVGSNDQVVAVRLMGGYSPDRLPDLDAFWLGGPDTVRGYDYGDQKGDSMLVANAEYRFRISDSVQGVVFADAGGAWDVDKPISLADLKSSVGVGIRFETPLGMMRLDYGYGFSQGSGNIQFSIGPSF